MVELEELMKLLKVNNQIYPDQYPGPPGSGPPLLPGMGPMGPLGPMGPPPQTGSRSGSAMGQGPMVIVSSTAGNYDDVTDVSGEN